MPLIHGKSAKAFKKNVETEMEAHPGKEHRAQNLAIAYSLKRKAQHKKMAAGGFVEEEKKSGYEDHFEKDKAMNIMAEGGQITDNYQSSMNPHKDADFPDKDHYVEEEASGYVAHEGDDKKHVAKAMMEDDRDLNQHGAHEVGPEGGGEGFHGEEYMGHHHDAHDMYSDTEDGDGMDMVGRIMKQREQMYSEGGRVANSGEGELDEMADSKPNNFDDLSLRDDLEEHYTGANSGDELSNAREDHDRSDIVARIMASRRKKDRNPVPA